MNFSLSCTSCRHERHGSLEVDSDDVMEGSSPGALQQLNVDNRLYIGMAMSLMREHL